MTYSSCQNAPEGSLIYLIMTLQLENQKLRNMTFSCQAYSKYRQVTIIAQKWSLQKHKSHQCNLPELLSGEKNIYQQCLLFVIKYLFVLSFIFKNKEMSICYEFVTLCTVSIFFFMLIFFFFLSDVVGLEFCILNEINY